jgi:hypothetical protein
LETGIEPYFALSIALTENPTLTPTAIHRNNDGSIDRGLMQLNNSWFTSEDWADAETNIRAACQHILYLRSLGLNYWQTAVAYNCGIKRVLENNPPEASIRYANKVFDTWAELSPRTFIFFFN